MIILLIILGIVLFVTVVNKYKVNVECEIERREFKEQDRERKTNPPYREGELYYYNYLYNGMVLSKNDDIVRYIGIPTELHNDNIDSAFLTCNIAVVKDLKYKTPFKEYINIPTIEELEVLGKHYDTYLQLYKKYSNHDVYDMRQERYSDRILSQTLTEDGEHIYVYNLRTKTRSSVSINDKDEIYGFIKLRDSRYYK